MTLTKSQVSAYLKDLFAKLDGSRIIRLMERFDRKIQPAIASLENVAMTKEAELVAGLPETFGPKDIVDALFKLAETLEPQYAAMLEFIRYYVDLLLTPAPTPSPVTLP